jgi:hypothetical protein
MTDAHYQFGLTFLHGKAFVATTRMLLFMYKLLLPPGWECLSTIGTSIPEETSIWLSTVLHKTRTPPYEKRKRGFRKRFS